MPPSGCLHLFSPRPATTGRLAFFVWSGAPFLVPPAASACKRCPCNFEDSGWWLALGEGGRARGRFWGFSFGVFHPHTPMPMGGCNPLNFRPLPTHLPPPLQTMAGAGLVAGNLAEFIDAHCLQRWFLATTGPPPPFTAAELDAALAGLRTSTAFPPILVSDWEARGKVFFKPGMADAIGFAINQALAAGV